MVSATERHMKLTTQLVSFITLCVIAAMAMVMLGGVFTVTGTIVTMGYGALAGRFGTLLARRAGVLDRVSAVLFAGLAGKLLVD